MNQNKKILPLLAAMTMLTVGQVQAAEPDSSGEWEFMVAPLFLWGMGIDGTTEIDGMGGDLDLDGLCFLGRSQSTSCWRSAGRRDHNGNAENLVDDMYSDR